MTGDVQRDMGAVHAAHGRQTQALAALAFYEGYLDADEFNTDAIARAVLAARLDQIQPDLHALQNPYRRAAEMTRRVDIATAYVHDLDCECGGLVECPKHYLLRVLEGDE